MHLKKNVLQVQPQPPSSQIPPQAETRQLDGGSVLALSGDWTIHTLKAASERISSLKNRAGRGLAGAVDLSGVTGLDTAGAFYINKLRSLAGGHPLPVRGERDSFLDLLKISELPASPDMPLRPAQGLRHSLLLGLNNIGAIVVSIGPQARDMLSFLGLFLITLARNAARPWNIRWTALIYHMGQAGVGAIPIVGLLSFLIGMVLAYMSASQMANFGIQIFVVKLLEVGVLREMAVLTTAILVAGRSGSSFTAQIGSMKANQEIDAMRSMGIDPMNTLVLPRVMALVLMLPVLTLAADITGMLGGLVAVWVSLDISPQLFVDTLVKGFAIKNFMVGLIKSPFFAVVIGCVGCFSGFQAGSSSDSVGRMTTTAVVQSIFLVITLDALFALSFMSLGL